jgi:hypothetical protein
MVPAQPGALARWHNNSSSKTSLKGGRVGDVITATLDAAAGSLIFSLNGVADGTPPITGIPPSCPLHAVLAVGGDAVKGCSVQLLSDAAAATAISAALAAPAEAAAAAPAKPAARARGAAPASKDTAAAFLRWAQEHGAGGAVEGKQGGQPEKLWNR